MGAGVTIVTPTTEGNRSSRSTKRPTGTIIVHSVLVYNPSLPSYRDSTTTAITTATTTTTTTWLVVIFSFGFFGCHTERGEFIKGAFGRFSVLVAILNPLRTAVPFWGQTTKNLRIFRKLSGREREPSENVPDTISAPLHRR